MFATFCEIFNPRNYFMNSLRVNYENSRRMEDRKMTITFFAKQTEAIGLHFLM